MPPPQNNQPDFIPDAAPDFIPDQPPAPRGTVPPPDPTEGPKIAQSALYANMFNVPPSTAYQMHDELSEQMKKLGAHSTLADDFNVGSESSIFGLMVRQKMPHELLNPDTVDKFVEGLTTMAYDLPWYLGGGAVGGAAGSEVPILGNAAGATAGSFAVPAAVRQALVEGISKGKATSFDDIMGRLKDVAEEAGKGAVTGLITHGAGEVALPIGGPTASLVMRRAQQIAAMTVIPAAFQGRLPTAQEFAVNAALFGAMHYGAQAFGLSTIAASKIHAKMLDIYQETGLRPSDVAAEALARSQSDPTEDPIDRLNSIVRDAREASATPEQEEEKTPNDAAKPSEDQPTPVVEPPAPGLRPAIRDNGEVTEGQPGSTHDETLSESGTKETEESERGFVDGDGNFYNRDEAKAWVRENEPETAKALEQVTGDPDAELHSEDYNEARQRSTGVKNASVDAQREQMGLPPIEGPMRSLDPDNWEVAKEDVDSGRVDPLAIAESVNANPRGMTPEETNAMNYYRARLSNEHKAVMDAIEKARANDDPNAEKAARARLEDVENRINTVDTATKRAGTEWGLTGQMRQRMIAEDYSLDRLLQRARVASKTGEVSPAIRDRLESLSNQLEKANKDFEEYRAKESERQAQRTVEKLKTDTVRTERKGDRVQVRVELKVEFDNLVKQFDKAIAGRVSANPFLDPELLGIVGKIAKNRVESGLTRIEDIVDDIHGALTTIGHDVTKRDIRDAISGYGKTVEMSKEAVDVTLREAKRQGKLISALEDAESAKIPERSGLQRDQASDRVRELQKQVKQAMRESGIDARKSQTPEAQWRTALDSVKTRLRNQIDDLNKQLKTGEKEAKRTGIVYDDEAKILKEQRDNLKAMLDTATQEPARRLATEQQRLAQAEKNLAEYRRKIKENDFTPEERRTGPETEAMTKLQNDLASARNTYAEMKKAAGPKPATDEETKLAAMQARIEEYERRVKEGDVATANRKEGPQTQRVAELQEKVDTARESYREMVKDSKAKTPAEMAERRIRATTKAMAKQIAEVERRIKEGDLTPAQRRSGRPEPREISVMRDRLDAMRETYRQLKDAAEPKKTPEEIALSRFKKYTQKRIEDMESRLKTGDFTKEPPKKTVLDPEANELKIKAEKLRNQVDEAIAKQQYESRSTPEKALHIFSKWRRAALLTSVNVFGKLGTAAMSRMGVTPIEELTGGVLSRIPGVSEIADRSPFEGKPSMSAEGKALAQIWDKATRDDIWSELKDGKISLDYLYGDEKGRGKMPAGVLDFIGHLHGAIKVLPKRAEFFRRVEIGTQWALDNHLDTEDPKVQSAIAAGAYQESLRAIFMQDNVVATTWSIALNYLHNRGVAGQAIEAVGRTMLPIVKVPTNLVAETLQYTPANLGYQTIRLFQTLFDENRMGKSAMDNLTMHDMDNIMRGLKKGTVGLALLGIGYALRNNITGYYAEKQKDKKSLGTMTVGGVEIPAFLQESPALSTLQMGATVGKVWDHYQVKGQGGGLIAGAAFAGAGVVQRVPFLDTPARIAEQTRTPESLGVFAGQLASSITTPAAVQQAAKWTDPEGQSAADAGHPRKATTPVQAVELGIPGLREDVPISGNQKRNKPAYRFSIKERK